MIWNKIKETYIVERRPLAETVNLSDADLGDGWEGV